MSHRFPFGAFLISATLCAMTPAPSAQTVSGPVLQGDLRFRHETVDQENADTRNMARLRARVNLTAKASDTVTLIFGVASGQTNEPITTNQNLTGGFSDKQLWIDLMYFDWTAGKSWLHVTGGKMKNPMYSAGRSQLVWDRDVNPEGLGIQIARKRGGMELFANGSFFWIEERPRKGFIYGGIQTGIRTTTGEMTLPVAPVFIDYLNIKGFSDLLRSLEILREFGRYR